MSASVAAFLERFPGPRLAILSLAVLLGVSTGLFGEVAAMPNNRGFATIKEILDKSCSSCHDWTGSYESITGGGRVIAGSPEKSLIYLKIANDEMPQEGEKLTAEQKAFIRGWIAAGAPSTELPIAVPAVDATASASPPAGQQSFLFFPDKRTFHIVAGFASTACFIGAGIIGTIHILDMMDQGHDRRDQIGFEEDGPESVRVAEIKNVWADNQALRWWHIGLLAAGEVLYVGDAITGVSMFTKQQPGKLTKRDIHRYAFFVHAGLMLAQVGLGFAETYALSTGQHDLTIGIGAAHAAVGLAIPAVMLGGGLGILLLPE